jgi:Protein of unknown function (DUF3617)
MRSAVLPMALVALALAAFAQAVEPVKPNIKPGLWEVSINPHVSGEMPIPEEQLAKLTPEQRARLEAMMKSRAANTTAPKLYKECMTPEKIARGFDMDRDDTGCKRKVVSSSANELTVHDECDKPNQKTVSDVHFEVKGGTQMSGRINVQVSSGAKTMTINNTMQGKWLGASCGAVKDAELEK